MITEDDFRAVRDSVNSGAISNASKAQLERFAVVLCHPHAFSFFGNNQFPQICETVRLHLLRAHIETLQGHITDLNAKNTTIQKWVIALAVAALVSTVIQAAVAIRAEVRATLQSGSIAGPQKQSAPATPAAGQKP